MWLPLLTRPLCPSKKRCSVLLELTVDKATDYQERDTDSITLRTDYKY